MSWLTPGGIAAALLVGGSVWWGLGWGGLASLLAFLLSGSLLTRLATGVSPRRNARQVIANGGVAAVAALLGRWPAATGALAAAAADTWATEIGTWSRRPPRLITSGAPVPRGHSGGITALGTAGGIAGAVFLAGVSVLASPGVSWRGLWLVAGAGIAGMLVDSLLGATFQGLYACPDCGAVTERPGPCHRPVQLIRGCSWLDNDGVNLAGALTGALVAAGLSVGR